MKCVAPLLACLVAATAFAAASHLPKANSRSAIVAYVTEAAQIVKTSGPSCATFSSPEWKGGEYYIFVIGPDDKLICHANPAMIGKSNAAIVNLKGEKVGEMIAATGKGNSKGWVNYMWAPPGKSSEELKTTYVMGVTGPDGKHYVVGGGGWRLTK